MRGFACLVFSVLLSLRHFLALDSFFIFFSDYDRYGTLPIDVMMKSSVFLTHRPHLHTTRGEHNGIKRLHIRPLLAVGTFRSPDKVSRLRPRYARGGSRPQEIHEDIKDAINVFYFRMFEKEIFVKHEFESRVVVVQLQEIINAERFCNSEVSISRIDYDLFVVLIVSYIKTPFHLFFREHDHLVAEFLFILGKSLVVVATDNIYLACIPRLS